jgi:tetratricopeptide (TPR) repeat protein
MTRVNSKDIAHAAVTNHRVLRKPPPLPEKGSKAPKITRNPLAHFHAELLSESDPNVDRDLGIALAGLAGGSTIKTHQSKTLLEKATQTHPDDLEAWLVLASIYGGQERHAKALETYEKALILDKNCEVSLFGAGDAAAANGKLDQALEHFKRASAVNPYNAHYHGSQARFYAQQRQWDKAAQEARTSLDLDFSNITVHQVFVESLLRLGSKAEAERELANLELFRPQKANQIREWIRNLSN